MLRRNRPSRSRHRSRGQALAEFALVVPILMLIIGGIIQFGIIFWGQNTLTQVVRDTGRWAATQTACGGTAGAVISTANSIAQQSSLIGFGGSFGSGDVDVNWTGSPCPPGDNQDEAWVRISITHSVPIFFPLVPDDFQLSSSTEFRMEPKPK